MELFSCTHVWHADPLCSARASPPRLDIPRLALQTHSHPRCWVRRELGLIDLSISLGILSYYIGVCLCVCMYKYTCIYVCVCIYIYIEREWEKLSERDRERLTLTHFFIHSADSFQSLFLFIHGFLVPPDTWRCGMARVESPNPALAPDTAVTMRDS